MLPATNSVQGAFQPAFDEIARRSKVTTDTTETTFFGRTPHATGGSFPVPQQQFVLLSMGTRVLAPRTVDAERPMLRVYGAFETRDDAVEHMRAVQDVDAGCSMIVAQQDKWLLMPQSETTRDDVSTNAAARDAALAKDAAARARADDAFDRDVCEHRGRDACTMEAVDDDAELEEAEDAVYARPKRLRAGAEVRGQSFVALCVIPRTSGECLLRILGLFDTSATADEWIQDVGSRHVTAHDIFVAPACEWMYPNSAHKNGKTRYRVDELQRIMDAAERNPEAVKTYKQWKRDQELAKLEEQPEDASSEAE